MSVVAAPPIRPAERLPTLDGIRGLAVCVVFAFHAWPSAHVPGGLAVTVFFFLSGLLITTLLRLELEESGSINLRHFYVRRGLRILPVFYLLLAATTAGKLLVEPEGVSAKAIAAIGAHLGNYWAIGHGWQGMPAAMRVAWSLAVEEHFYLFFPAALLLLHSVTRDRRRQAAAILAACIATLAWRCYLVSAGPLQPTRLFAATDTRIDSILFGCALALWGNPALDPTRLGRRMWVALLAPISLGALAVSTAISGRSLIVDAVRYSVEGLALVPLFVAGVRYPAHPVFAWLNSVVMRTLGRLSYSIYLVHVGILAALARAGVRSATWRGLLALALSIAAAEIIYRAVEAPCARVRRRMTGSGEQSLRSSVALETRPAEAAC